jgi:hypothetical protein
MSKSVLARYIGAVVLTLLAASALTACSKKEAQATPPPEPAPAPTQATTEQPAPAPEAAPAVSINTVNITDAKAAMTAADQALRARQYEETAKLLLALQAQQLNEKQAAAVRAQMVRFQGALANALADGDQNAKAAADALRASASGAGR